MARQYRFITTQGIIVWTLCYWYCSDW